MNLFGRSLEIRNGFLKGLIFNYIWKSRENFRSWRWLHIEKFTAGGGYSMCKGPEVDGVMWVGGGQSALWQ